MGGGSEDTHPRERCKVQVYAGADTWYCQPVRILSISAFAGLALASIPDASANRPTDLFAQSPKRTSPIAVQAAPGDYVVRLHGMNRTKESMEKLADRLHAAGFFTLAIDYPALRDELADIADEIVAPAVATYCTDPRRRIHFVGHSLGNIVARTYLAGDHRPPNLGRVVMLAAPNNGSPIIDALGDNPLVAALVGPACGELRTCEESFVRRLPPPDYPAGVIMGNRPVLPFFRKLLTDDCDGIVGVEDGRLPGLADFLVVHAGHTLIMRSPEVGRQVLAFLHQGAFASGAPALQ
ncbi:alpha/beta fold hydrolase [soil metagenome]